MSTQGTGIFEPLPDGSGRKYELSWEEVARRRRNQPPQGSKQFGPGGQATTMDVGIPVEYGDPITRAPGPFKVGNLLPGVQPAEAIELPDINMSDVSPNFTVERPAPVVRLHRKYAYSQLNKEDTKREIDSYSMSAIKEDFIKRELSLTKLQGELSELRSGLDLITAPQYQPGQLDTGQQVSTLLSGLFGGAQGFNQAASAGYEQADFMAKQRYGEANQAFERQLGQQQELIQNKAGEIDLEKKAMIQLSFKELEELAKMDDDDRTRKLEEFKQGEITKRGQMRVDERIGKQKADLMREFVRAQLKTVPDLSKAEDRQRVMMTLTMAAQTGAVDPEILLEPEFQEALAGPTYSGAASVAKTRGANATAAKRERETGLLNKYGDQKAQDEHKKAVATVDNWRNQIKNRDKNTLLREAQINQGSVKELIGILRGGAAANRNALSAVDARIANLKRDYAILSGKTDPESLAMARNIEGLIAAAENDRADLDNNLNEIQSTMFEVSEFLYGSEGAKEARETYGPGAVDTRDTTSFVESLAPKVRQIAMQKGIPPSVVIAQAILESRSGKSGLARSGNNLFGIKGKGDAGSISMNTREVANGQSYSTKAAFRKYSSLDSSIADHANLISQGRYRGVVGKSGMEAADALQAAGYATDPQYAAKLKQLIKAYNLERFDVRHEDLTGGRQYGPQRPATKKPVTKNGITVPGDFKIE